MSTATVEKPDWAVGDLEPTLRKLRNTIGLFDHLVSSDYEVTAEQWYQVQDDLTASADQIEALWQRAWDQHFVEKQAHAASIEALRAEKAAPGSKADAAEVATSWELLAAATNVAAKNCIEAGYPLVPFGPKSVRPAPKHVRRNSKPATTPKQSRKSKRKRAA